MSARILVIEDNPVNLELVTYLLHAFGFQTDQAVDGLQGLAQARAVRPDLILCDIQMPVMDGLEFVRHAKADPALRSIPMVALTAYAMVGDEERILAAGFDAYIAKPFEPHTFVGTLNRLLSQPVTLPTWAPAKNGDKPTRDDVAIAHILVLDDEPLNLALKRSLLEPHGYRVTTVLTVDEAKASLQQRVPDLIISDVDRDTGGGFAFIQWVKRDARFQSVPFIFITSCCWSDEERERGLSLGAQRYLLRPLEPAAVLCEVQACLRRV